MTAAVVKASFEVNGTVLTIKVSKGRGRELTYKFRNSMPATKWAEQLLEIVEDIVPNISGDAHIRPYEGPPEDTYQPPPPEPVQALSGPPPMSEEESRRRTAAYIKSFTTNDGHGWVQPGINGITEDQIMGLAEVSPELAAAMAPAPHVPNTVFPEAYAGRPIVSPNEALPDTDKRV